MGLIHWLTKVRYEIMIQAKLPVSDSIFENIIELYYKIPYFRAGVIPSGRQRRMIISLTTIPSRLNKVWLTIESLLRQSKKPDKIILWLAEDEFHGIDLPEVLKGQQKRGLEIRYCKNLKSYKKFFYTMLEHPNDYVLVVDDDFIYSEKLLAEMMKASIENPDSIVCNRAHKIRMDKNGVFPYFRWIWYENRRIKEEYPSFHNFLTSGGGTLFPVWLLDKEIFREDVFIKIAPTADDVWLNFNAWRSRLKVVMTRGVLGYMIPIHNNSDAGLYLKNLARNAESGECENDYQIRNVLEYLNLNINESIQEGERQ